MPLWSYWAVFFAVIGVTLLVAAWLEARDAASPAARDAAAKPPERFERPSPKAVEAIEPPGPVDPFARTMEIERVVAVPTAPTDLPAPPKREDDGPTRE